MLQEEKKRGFEVIKPDKRTLSDQVVKLPIRGTKTSAGIDFFATEDLVIRPQEKVVFKTDIKSYMEEDEMLLILPRSSTGFKHDLMLVNTIGLIDSDFYENEDNDGNIGIGLRNLRPEMTIRCYTKVTDVKGQVWDMPIIEDLTIKNTVIIKAGEKICQGVFAKYLEADNCISDVTRSGGIGSTDANKGDKE